MITAVSVRGRDASAEWLLPWSSMTGSEHLGRQVRVDYGPSFIPNADGRRNVCCPQTHQTEIGQKRPHERHPDSIRSDQTGSSGSDDGGS